MTYKINGIDVSEWELKGVLIPITECKYFEGIGDCKETKGLCIDNEGCYFKQLKRLEQQIETYKQSENEAKEIIAELKHENKRLQEKNEELKKYQYTQEYLQSEIEKRQKALEEIREIVSGNYETLDPQAKQDTEKLINEVLNDRD